MVSLMLGREVARVRAEGATAFDAAGHAARSADPALRAENLEVRHKVRGVSLDVYPGEVVGLGGLLGSGRSETAKAIIGALPTDGGRVEVGGRPLRHRTPASAIRAGVMMLAEDRKAEGIIPSLSVRENIVLAALPRMSRAGVVSPSKQDAVVKLFMDRLRIKASGPEQRVSDLSGGNQQKVLLARWLCMNPKALLLDEPTRGIDVGAKAEVQALIDELARDGLAVLLISSELEELIEGSDRVVVLKDGGVVGHLDGADVTEEQLMRTLASAGPDTDVDAGSDAYADGTAYADTAAAAGAAGDAALEPEPASATGEEQIR
jgi:ribose transport system ATP-binding protein